MVAVVRQAVGEADVGGRIEKHVVPLGTEYIQSTDYAPQHAVFIADALRGKSLHPIPIFVPLNDGIKIFLPGSEISEGRMLSPADDGLGDGGNRGEIHIRNPHGDEIKAFFRRCGSHGVLPQGGNGKRIHSVTLHNRCKIVFHGKHSFVMKKWMINNITN